MNENYFVPLGIAKELDEINYDGKSIAQIDRYKAPIFQDVFVWFYEKHKIFINLISTNRLKWEITANDKIYKQEEHNILSPYETNKEALYKAIEIYKKLKENKNE